MSQYLCRPFLVVLIVLTVSLGLTNSAQAKQIYSGIFGLAAWGNWNDAFDITRANGFEIVADLSTKSAFDMAQARGMKGFVRFSSYTPDMATDDVKWQQFLAGVRNKVIELKDHPAVFGWYLVDEPDYQNVPISRIKEMNALVRSLDNHKHPILTVLTITNKWTAYLPYYDIISVDPYLRKNVKSVPDTPAKVKDWLRKIKRDMKIAKVSKPLWVTLGAFDLIPKSSADTNVFLKPTPQEFDQMVDYAKAEGVDGILVFTFGLINNAKYEDWTMIRNDPALWEAVRKMPSRVKTP